MDTPQEPQNAQPDPPDPAATSGTAGPRRLLGRYDALMAFVFGLLWLVPITYVGSAAKDITELPRIMKHQYRVACLFTRDVRSWSTYHVEIQTNGSDAWVEMPIDGIFDMTVFGYRSKLHRLCGKSFRGRWARDRMTEITDYIKARRRALHPDAPKLDGIRISRVSHPIKVLAKETGRFTRRTLAEYLAEGRHRYLFGEQRWDGKRPQNVVWRSKRRSKRTDRLKNSFRPLRTPQPKRIQAPKRIGDPRKMLQLKPKKDGE